MIFLSLTNRMNHYMGVKYGGISALIFFVQNSFPSKQYNQLLGNGSVMGRTHPLLDGVPRGPG